VPGKNLRHGTKDFRAAFPDLTSLEEDLLLLEPYGARWFRLRRDGQRLPP